MSNNIAVLLSGNGSNLNAIINKGINVSFVVSNNTEAPGLKIAQKSNIPTYSWKNLSALEVHVSELVKIHNINLVVLAGFMRLLSKQFINSLPKHSIINVHPSILPEFKGLNAIQQAIDSGAKYTGVTIHYVDEGIDTGDIIQQETIKIDKNDTIISLKKRLQALEHDLYPKVIESILSTINKKIRA
jgi:phosphoribosylglycinamide formyltransferase-1